jgi:hypothetical protein
MGKDDRASALKDLVPTLTRLPDADANAVWSHATRILAGRPRPDSTQDLAVLLLLAVRLGGPGSLDEAAEALREVRELWP